MNISANSLSSMITKLSGSYNSIYNQSRSNDLAQLASSQQNSTDQVELSKMGRLMSQLMRNGGEDPTEMKARMDTFKTAYDELGIAELDATTMSDDEIKAVLGEFANAMGNYQPSDLKPVSDMSSTELKDALSRIQDMGSHLNQKSDQTYGPMSGGRPLGGGADMKSTVDAFLSAYQSSGIGDADTSSLTDDEMLALLEKFETALSDSTASTTGKSISDMSSTELKDTLTKLQTIGNKITEDQKNGQMNGPGGRPPMGRPPMGGPGGTGASDSSSAEETDETDSTDEETLIEQLLAALEERDAEEQQKTTFNATYRDMFELMNQLKSSTN